MGAPCHPLNGVSGRPLRTATPAHPPTADARRNDPPPPLPGTRGGVPPHRPPQAALVRAPATDAGWLGGHPLPDGTDRGSRHPGATVRALAPPQAALRAPQSLWHSDRPNLAPPGGAVDGPCRPRATTSLHVGPQGGPTQAHHTRLDSPPPLRLPCERCVGGTRTQKYPTRFPLSTP